jgi:serine/threonine protein kinase/tetratricopeptide (TPR) repeat protein
MGSRSRSPAPHSRAPVSKRFTVERCLGEGSMGAVFAAFDRERGTTVALKTLRRVDASGIYRFKREFRALADVSHPNLVQLYELFSEGNEWFFTMELVEGRDFLGYVLGDSKRTGDFSARDTRELRGAAPLARARGMEVLFPSPLKHPDRLRAVLQQVVRGLMALHATGKLHRDLKPDNVMVTAEGRAIVLDFGIAAELEPDRHDTLEAGVMGTPAYMSPEQATSAKVTEATDWYALGVVLYEALTGRVPFDGSFAEVLQQKQIEDPAAPSQLVADVPAGLDTLCMRLLARDPSERPSGPEILEALGAAEDELQLPNADADLPFLGREAELLELERALASTADGASAVAFLHGPTGMGKTALVERFLDRASVSGAAVLTGRCYEHESVPFKALDSLVDSLTRYLGKLSPVDAAEVLPKDVPSLVQLFPVLDRVDVVRMARRRGRLATDPRTQRQQATLALKELLARIAMRQALVVFIDDLQWGDVDSARPLVELVSGQDRPAMLLVCTYRSADKERSPCVAALQELLRDHSRAQVRDIELRELGQRESLALAERMLQGDDPAAAAVAREARGNPYLLAQLVDHLRSERRSAPEPDTDVRVSLERALSERLDGLSADASRVLDLVAVSGRPVSETLLAKLDVEGLNLAGALTELRRVKLVRGVGSTEGRAISLYHDSLRDPVLTRMGEDAVRTWHKRLARAIEDTEPIDHEALIDHLIGSGDHGRASLFAIGAAHAAMEALAFDKAAELYEIAVRYHDDTGWRHELLIQWAEALTNAGRSTRAAEVYLQASKRASPEDAASLQIKAGTQLLASGRWARGAEVVGPPLAKLGIALPRSSDDSWQVAYRLWPKLRDHGFDFTPRTAAEVPKETLARLDMLWSLVQATLGGDPLVCQVFVLHYLTEALAAGETSRVVVGLCAYYIVVDLAYSDIGGFKPKSLQRAEVVCQKIDDPRCHAWLAFARAFSFQNQGMLKPAALDFARAEELLRTRCRDVAPEIAACRMLYAHVVGMMEQIEDLAVCGQWIREAMEREDLMVATRLRLIMLPRLLVEDDLTRVRRLLVLPEELPTGGGGLTDLIAFGASINVALYDDDPAAIERALAMVPSFEKSPLLVVRIWRGDTFLYHVRGLLGAAAHAADPEPFLTKAERLLTNVESMALECHVDQTRLLRATIAHRRGDRARSLELLDAVLQDADVLGDQRYLVACARLRKGGVHGGDLGRDLVKEAERALIRRGIKAPARFARVFAPGWEPAAVPPVTGEPESAPSGSSSASAA